MSSPKVSVEINEDLLSAVQQILSTTTLQETIEEAFREVIRTEARRQEVETLSRSGMDLADRDVMSGAWRKGL